jgi:DNA-binding MarR family transcriptional regulator
MRNIRIGTSITNELAPLFRRVSRVHNRSLEAFELKAVDAHILAALLDGGPLAVGEVQQQLGLRGSTLTGALDRLEKRGLLKRQPSPNDRRSWVLEAAKVPARMREGLEAALEEAERTCWGALTKTERSQLLKLLQKANDGLSGEETR